MIAWCQFLLTEFMSCKQVEAWELAYLSKQNDVQSLALDRPDGMVKSKNNVSNRRSSRMKRR